MRHELSPELLRLMTLTSAVLKPQEFLTARVLDALCPPDDIASRAMAAAKGLAAQPGFRAVKRQIRGGLAERLAARVASGHDAFLGEFG